MDNAQRFLSAFVQIEKKLRLIAGETRYEKFYRLLAEAGRKNKIVQRYEFQLQEYADLRNAIVHQRDGVGQVIAQPTDEVVDEIEHILEILKEDPPVSRYFLKKVVVCNKDDGILEIQKIMRKNDFSKIPVVENGSVIGLLYIEDIATWACDELRNPSDKWQVKDIMEPLKGKRNVQFIGKSISIFDVASIFNQGIKQGHRIEAIFITETGLKNQKLIGIITVKDLPLILECF